MEVGDQGRLKTKTENHNVTPSNENFLVAQMVKGLCLQHRRPRFDPWVRKIPLSKKCQPTPVFLPRESHEQRSLVGYSLWGSKGLDTTEQLSH